MPAAADNPHVPAEFVRTHRLFASPSSHSWCRDAFGISVLAVTYFLAAKFGLSLALVNASATAVWPPTGLSLAVLLLFGTRLWPGIALGAFAANLTTQGTVPVALGISASNTLEAVAGAWLVRRFANGLRAFDRIPDILTFIVVAGVASTAISATGGVITLLLAGYASWEWYGAIWVTWWVGDMVSNLILAPFLLVWGSKPLPRLSRRRALEAAGWLALMWAISRVAFSRWFLIPTHPYPLAFLCLLPVIGSAVRFHHHGATLTTLLLSGLAIVGTLHRIGPFAALESNASLLWLQVFIGTITMTGLMLAAVIAQRLQVEEALRRAHDELERRVAARTAELARTNRELTVQVDKRRRAEDAAQRLAALVESSNDAIYSTTLEGVVTSWNAAAERSYGYTAPEVVGREIGFLLPPYQENEVAGIVERLKRGESVESYETVRLRKDGETLHLSLTASPIKDAEDRITGLSFIARDITERRRLEHEILSVSEREQQRIGRDLHDGLCQQLTGITLMCHVLEQKLAVQAPAEAAEIAQVSALINQCIAETRDLVRGLHPPSLTGGNLLSALQELTSTVKEFSPIVCQFTHADADVPVEPLVTLHLYRIAQEAVQNAIRHGRATRVSINLRTDVGERLILTITDNGRGFARPPGQRTGLGLRIMDHRAKMIGASLAVQPVTPRGTVVTCTLRYARGAPPKGTVGHERLTLAHADREATG